MRQSMGLSRRRLVSLTTPPDLRYIPVMEQREPTIQELLDRLHECPANKIPGCDRLRPVLVFFLPIFADKDANSPVPRQAELDSPGRTGGVMGADLARRCDSRWYPQPHLLDWHHLQDIGLGRALHSRRSDIDGYFVAIIYGAIKPLPVAKRAIPLVGVYARQLPL